MTARTASLVVLAAALCVAAGGVGAAEGKPQRIVSINVCTDQLAMLLAPRARIKSVSFLAADPASSAMAEEARGLHLNHGLAEEVLPLKPDIVLAGAYGARHAVALLRRLGQRVVELPLGNTLDDVAVQVRFVAGALGEVARGEALIAAFRARLARLPAPAPGGRPLAVLFESSGVTSGRDSLPDAVMDAAGFDNLAARLGVSGVGRVPMEVIVAARPDVLIRGRLEPQYPSLAAGTLAHPALTRAVADGAVIDMPDSLWSCATPRIVAAVERLAALRARLAAGTGGP